jgi:succinate dehydrogenase/fumarate reductase flavoprotein subunit
MIRNAHARHTGPQAQGEGVKLGKDIGAELVGMEHVQVHALAMNSNSVEQRTAL